MAFFKFRKDGEDHTSTANAPESIETLRKRARYRLAGAAVLVLAGVIGFPLLFDNQPRPIAVDIPIVIPDKEQAKAAPLVVPASTGASAASVDQAASGASVAVAAVEPSAPSPVVPATQSKATAKATPTPASTPDSQILTESKDGKDPKSAKESKVTKEAGKDAAKPVKSAKDGKDGKDAKDPKDSKLNSDAARAQALLDGKATSPAAADSGRFVVQFGSFSDAARAHEARLKVEKAGFKTYAQIAQGPDGKRFRVRVGPFTQRAEAEKAAEKIKKLDLAVSILTL